MVEVADPASPRPDEPVRHLYFHIPWCHRICPYCSFYKHSPRIGDVPRFIQALIREAAAAAREFDGLLHPETVYFGGGTPTFLSTLQLDELLAGLHRHLDLSRVREWTVEINPRTITPEKAAVLRSHGVTRASLGVQAWDAPTLRTLGRDHSPDDAREAFDALRSAGFPVIGIDLMFSVPGQSLDAWKETLRTTVRLHPEHISAYNLTWEEDTEFLRRLQAGEFREDPDRDADCFAAAMDILEAAGYHHYEISNYARPGFESVHNRAYWAGRDYLGFGPSAVSTVHGTRWTRLADTAHWTEATLAGRPTRTATETITAENRLCERIALSLRTSTGLPPSLIPRAAPTIAALTSENLLTTSPAGNLILTRTGRFHADTIAASLWLAAHPD